MTKPAPTTPDAAEMLNVALAKIPARVAAMQVDTSEMRNRLMMAAAMRAMWMSVHQPASLAREVLDAP